MGTTKERLACLEIEIKYIKKMVNTILVIVIAQAGVSFVPYAFLTLA